MFCNIIEGIVFDGLVSLTMVAIKFSHCVTRVFFGVRVHAFVRLPVLPQKTLKITCGDL